MRARIRLAALILPALLCAGCAKSIDPVSYWELKAPLAKVVGARVAEQTDQGVRIEITVELTNPNNVALPLVSDGYNISVEGAGAADLEDNPNCTISPDGKQLVVLPVAFATHGKPLGAAGWSVRGHITYKPPGEFQALLTESQVPLPTVSFSGSGKLD